MPPKIEPPTAAEIAFAQLSEPGRMAILRADIEKLRRQVAAIRAIVRALEEVGDPRPSNDDSALIHMWEAEDQLSGAANRINLAIRALQAELDALEADGEN